jgi:hypothetical protein
MTMADETIKDSAISFRDLPDIAYRFAGLQHFIDARLTHFALHPRESSVGRHGC